MMRLTFRPLLTGVLLAIWCAAFSGLALPFAPLVPLTPQALLLIHLISSLGGSVPLVVYLSRHWWLRRQKIAQHRNTLHGYIILACLVLLALSGFALLVWTNVTVLRGLHDAALIILLIDLGLHLSWRVWQRRPSTPSRSRFRTLKQWSMIGLLSAIGVVFLANRVPALAASAVSVPLAHASLGSNTLFTASDCASCHSAITQQWQKSAHAHASTEAYYQAVATLFIEERGPNAVQFCAACHNPIGLVQGEVDVKAVGRVNAVGGAAYQARKLGITLPISARAVEGVTCALCHQAAPAATTPGNGSLQLATNLAALPATVLDQLSLRAAPYAHKAVLLRPVVQQAELCGSCHNLRLPNNGVALEPTFDEWQASPYPARGVTCQSCHFPQVAGSKADTSSLATVGAHGIVPGALSSLPGMADDQSLLRKAAALEARLAPDPVDATTLIATVIVTNTGAGHHLPTGASDLRQLWLELTLRDRDGQVVWSSGVLDQYGVLDPSTIQFRKVLGDAHDQPIDLHRVWVATQILSDTSLLPLEARTITYPIGLPSRPSSPLTLTVRLLYRDVSQSFAEFAQNQPVSDLPTRELARSDIELK
jgi:hypothetical protein